MSRSAGARKRSTSPCVSEQPQRIDVRLAPGTGFCAERGIERIDVLKIDVEGAELAVRRARRDLIDATGVVLDRAPRI